MQKRTLVQFEQDENFYKGIYKASFSQPSVQYVGVLNRFESVVSNSTVLQDGSRPDIWLLSLNVRDYDAQTMISQVRQIAPRATIIGILDADVPQVRSVARQSGADDVLVKHANYDEFLSRVLFIDQQKNSFAQHQNANEYVQPTGSYEEEVFANRNHFGNNVQNQPSPQGRIQQNNQSYAQGQPQPQPQPQQNAFNSPFAQQQPMDQGYVGQTGQTQVQNGFSNENSGYFPEDNSQINHFSAVQQKTIAVAGTKGGSGKTTIACELANACSMVKPKNSNQKFRVCLVDFDLEKPNVTVHLGLKGANATLSTWIEDIHYREKTTPKANLNYTFQEVRNWLSRVDKTDLYVLRAPVSSLEQQRMTADDYDYVLKQLKNLFDIVVIDCTNNNTTDYTYRAFQNATNVIYVVTPDRASLNDFKATMVLLQQVGIDRTKFVALGNRIHNGTGSIGVSEIKEFSARLDVPFIGSLPRLDVVERSRNENFIMVVDKPNEFTNALKLAVNQILPIFSPNKKGSVSKKTSTEKQGSSSSSSSGGFFARLFGKA